MPANSQEGEKPTEVEKTEVLETLAKKWTKFPGIEERGVSGRIVLAGNHITRPDLDANWNIVAAAIEAVGSRPSVYALEDAVVHFFHLTRPKGKPPVPSLSQILPYARMEDQEYDHDVRRSSSSLPDVGSDEEDVADCEAG
ncbi:unnamed protein product [Symbiodinium sp. CCMP2592]|nr:unnamed protein product [Symbiodinium sp. CCMP2592]